MPSFRLWLKAACIAIASSLFAVYLVDARAADRLDWLTNLDTAKQTAAASGKDLFIVFTGSNWCGHCMTLDREDLNTDEFAAVAGDFVLVRLDYLADA
ncbi:MAG TPA: thioredoxin family protein, partial [Pirellulales bacterium]|nr:thioredoxin family protein [Pirellulales bacterium]